MGLGNNRDYKTWERTIRGRLARHAARMNELMAQGIERIEASRRALEEMNAAGKAKREGK